MLLLYYQWLDASNRCVYGFRTVFFFSSIYIFLQYILKTKTCDERQVKNHTVSIKMGRGKVSISASDNSLEIPTEDYQSLSLCHSSSWITALPPFSTFPYSASPLLLSLHFLWFLSIAGSDNLHNRLTTESSSPRMSLYCMHTATFPLLAAGYFNPFQIGLHRVSWGSADILPAAAQSMFWEVKGLWGLRDSYSFLPGIQVQLTALTVSTVGMKANEQSEKKENRKYGNTTIVFVLFSLLP